MTGKVARKRSGEQTRQRILAAAALQFARTSYEEVKLRDIARDVGIDVAYVHRCFGSKEQLFADVLEATRDSGPSILGEKQDLPRIFTDESFNRDAIGFGIFICSLSSPKAREIIKAFGLREFIEPLAAKLPEPALLRATLLLACMTGLKVTREVLGVDPLANMSSEDCRGLIEGIFAACLDENRGASRKTAVAAPKAARSRQRAAPKGRGAGNTIDRTRDHGASDRRRRVAPAQEK
ncbi:transcriptional regulator, TetR family [Enhydrobacter aerosaccus]|uniref:Transcriptional regulator, TetR family n=1 Tax=Enhydrobacter aerosaccus TaxID=225324 RepID=A0A1T4TG36_9HYPH|nr:TetR family transcriptional regulator [Enhydrobacter aerosaccus]SKA39410.1 transcriptional regulator, TetR family [Enhydrobacter aerosaccus]